MKRQDEEYESAVYMLKCVNAFLAGLIFVALFLLALVDES